MSNIVKLQCGPRTAAVEIETPDVIVPALTKLSGRRDPIDVLRLCEELPPIPQPPLVWAASRRPIVSPRFIAALVKFIRMKGGDAYFERCLGTARYRQLTQRYPVSEPFEPL